MGGTRYALDSNFVPNAGQWYRLAVVSDGTQLTMYADKMDGNGYLSVGSLTMTGATTADNAMAAPSPNVNWTFGRGWYNGGFGDNIAGNLDNIRFSEAALDPSSFLPVPEPSTMSLALVGGFAAFGKFRRMKNR